MPDDPHSLSADGEAYLTRLRLLTEHVDPTADDPRADEIRSAGDSLDALPEITIDSLAAWVEAHPADVYSLGLACGLSQEKLKNHLKAKFGTSGWVTLGRTRPRDVVEWLEDDFGLLGMLDGQRGRTYTFGDILAARGTTRTTAGSAGVAGKLIEDSVEAIVVALGLPYEMRGRFTGRHGNTGPADVAIPSFAACRIAIGCKGFDSTGSKLTAAVNEMDLMAEVSTASQYIFGIVDGIAWHSRLGDFRRLYALLEAEHIDGLYSLADLDRFRADLVAAAQRIGLLP